MKHRRSVLRPAGLALVTLATLAPVGAAQAQQQPFRVITVPWVPARPDVPHEGVAGQWHYFQAVARGGNCPTVEYRWDFDGDGAWDSNGGNFANAQSRWNLGPAGGMKSQFPALAADRLFVARVEGRCGAETDTAEFPVRVRSAPTRPQRLNRAVSNGLWYAHLQLTRDVPNSRAWWTETHNTSLIAQAFMNRGHRAGVDPETDPFVEDAQFMVNWLLTRFQTINITGGNVGGVDPDTLDNDIGLKTSAGNPNYSGGPQLEALASWGDMDYIAPAGSGNNVAGRRLGDIVHDAADYFMWAQTDIAFNGDYAGGWDYNDNSGAPDTSQVGWASVALFSAEVNAGIAIPDWVKNRTRNVVAYNDASRGGNAALYGGYGYHSYGDAGANTARSGAMLNALGFALSRNRDDDRVRATIDYIANTLDTIPPDSWDTNAPVFRPAQGTANYYGLYQVTKGLRSFGEPIRFIGAQNMDWYARFSDFLIATQDANGAWYNDHRWMASYDPLMTHGLALLIAIPTIFETPPVAVADATPTLAGPGDQIVFGHAHSYAADASVPLVTFRWNFIDYPTGLDLNNDGLFDQPGEHPPEDANADGQVLGDEIVWDFETIDPDARPSYTYNPPGLDFGDEVQYRVTLQVVDRLNRTAIDDESVRIRVSIINHPPVALPHNSRDPDRAYVVVPGRTYLLDGSQSYDPDADDLPALGFPRDSITSYAWDTDGNGSFETAGPSVQFQVPANWVPGENRSIQFKVCDDGRWVGVEDAACVGGDCSLCSERSVRFQVVPNQAPVAVADPNVVDIGEGGTVQIDASGSADPEGGALTYSWSCDEPLVFDATPEGLLTVGPGEFDVTIDGLLVNCWLTVTDDLGASNYVSVDVRLANGNPVIQAVDVPLTTNEAEPVTLNVTATDPAPADAVALTYSVDCDGDFAVDVIDSFSPMLDCSWRDEGVFTGTVVVADDDGGVDTHEFTIEVLNVAPTLDAVVCPAATEGTPVAINLRTRDPGPDDQLVCALSAPVPAGAALNGCLLLWTPNYAQAVRGLVDFAVTVSDGDGGEGSTRFQCRPRWLDADGDGVPDTWEDQNGVDDPTGDPDGDGLTNQDEFDLGTDPHVFDGATPPVLIDPIGGEAVNTTTPALTLRNARDNNPRGQALRYEYQVFADASLRQLVTVSNLEPETPVQSSWPVPAGFLQENHTYWWTARANNGLAFGNAPNPETFVINAVNEAPTAPSILRPEDGDAVGSRRPTLVVDNASDGDPGDTDLDLECEIALDEDFVDVVQEPGGAQSDAGSTALDLAADLDEHTQYFARCRAVDAAGLAGEWSLSVSFTVDTGNQPPAAPVCLSPALDSVVRQLDGVLLVAGNASDPESDSLTYRFELSDDPTFPADTTIVSAELPEDPSGQTSFAVADMLRDNTFYFYRVRARDGRAAGPSCTSRFRVDLVNEPPTVPVPINPWIDTVSEPTPRFVWAESTDPEGDDITYEVVLFADAEGNVEVWRGRTANTLIDYDGAERLPGGNYWWQVRAEDEVEGHTSDWSMRIHFIVPGEVAPVADQGAKPEDAEVVDAEVVVDAAVVTPDAAEADAEVDAATPDAAPVPEVDAEVVEKDAALVELDAEPEPDAKKQDNKISRSVSGAGCTTSAPGQRTGALALGLAMLGLAAARRRRR